MILKKSKVISASITLPKVIRINPGIQNVFPSWRRCTEMNFTIPTTQTSSVVNEMKRNKWEGLVSPREGPDWGSQCTPTCGSGALDAKDKCRSSLCSRIWKACEIFIFRPLSFYFFNQRICTPFFRREAAASRALPSGEFNRGWEDSNPRPSRLNATTLSVWPPPACTILRYSLRHYSVLWGSNCIRNVKWTKLSQIGVGRHVTFGLPLSLRKIYSYYTGCDCLLLRQP